MIGQAACGGETAGIRHLGREAARLGAGFAADARHLQIAALGLLLAYNLVVLDFGARLLQSLVVIASALLAQIAWARLCGEKGTDLRSPLITGLSLSLLLRTGDPWILILAAVLAIGSKFLLRVRGKHIWNPATFGILAAVFGTGQAWISPGQWGSSALLGTLIAFLALAVLGRAGRWDTAVAFLGTHAALLLARALWLGDPLSIPLHQLQSGSLLLFSFFMITDPRSTPDDWRARVAFAVAVACLGHWLAFWMQMRPALYVSLFALSPLVPLLDWALPARRFAWRPQDATAV